MLPQLLVSSAVFFAAARNLTTSPVVFPPQLEGFPVHLRLLPPSLSRFYGRLTKEELEVVDDSYLLHHGNLTARVEYVDEHTVQLADQFRFVFSKFYDQVRGFARPLRFFYLWRVVHVLDDLLIHDASKEGLNKFIADLIGEWKLLRIPHQKQFEWVFPEIADRIRSPELQKFAEIGRKKWSYERFAVPTD